MDDKATDDTATPCKRRASVQPRNRITDEMDFENPDKDYVDPGENISHSSVMVFARVKYWSAAKDGPRIEGKRPDDLHRASEMLAEAFAACWRAGYKSHDLFAELMRTLPHK